MITTNDTSIAITHHITHDTHENHKQSSDRIHFFTIQRSPAAEGGTPPPAGRVTYWFCKAKAARQITHHIAHDNHDNHKTQQIWLLLLLVLFVIIIINSVIIITRCQDHAGPHAARDHHLGHDADRDDNILITVYINQLNVTLL